MKAIVQSRYGEADVLRFEEVEKPVAGEDQVLIEVKAVGIDAGVWHVMAGVPYLVRPMFGSASTQEPDPGLGAFRSGGRNRWRGGRLQSRG